MKDRWTYKKITFSELLLISNYEKLDLQLVRWSQGFLKNQVMKPNQHLATWIPFSEAKKVSLGRLRPQFFWGLLIWCLLGCFQEPVLFNASVKDNILCLGLGFFGVTGKVGPVRKKFFGVERYTLLGNDHMGVSKNRGTPTWTVYNGKPY